MTSENTLFYGDNLTILRDPHHFPDASVDLIYLDPPFNSNRSYNVLFRDESGRDSDAQITAFEDSWHWGRSTEDLYTDLVTGADERLVNVVLISALVGDLDRPGLLGRNQMSAYLVMMAARLVELHRVLKPSGSLYLHCDPTASHYLKMLLDGIFGPWNFRNEIVWKRHSAHNDPKRYGRISDTIFFYSMSDDFTWNVLRTEYADEYVNRFFRYKDERGKFQANNLTGAGIRAGETGEAWRDYNPTDIARHWSVPKRIVEHLGGPEALKWSVQERLNLMDEHDYIYWPSTNKQPRFKQYLDESPGIPLQNLWLDVKPLAGKHTERLGYPTQKPLALLERIIRASSNPGDVVLDPFCGCGTAIDAAQSLGRRWLGIDVTHLSVALMKYRLQDRHGLRAGHSPRQVEGHDYRVIGEPQDLAGARNLAQQEHDGRYQFQWWALSLVGARPLGSQGSGRRGKKGADGGVDGLIHFLDEDKRTQRVVVQVKSGKVSRPDIGDLRGLLDAGAAIGVFITLEPPTGPMQQEAFGAGYYESELWGRFPRIQILTIEQLLDGATVEMPTRFRGGAGTFRQAPRAREERGEQKPLL